MIDVRDRVQLYRSDVVAFAQEQFFIDGPDGEPRPIELFDHQARILRKIFEPDEYGELPSEVVFSTIKKSGKTTIGGLLGEYIAFAHTPPSAEVIIAANDLEQAQNRVFRDIFHSVESNVNLAGTELGVRTITLSTGVKINAISKDYASAAGSRHAAAIFDELWAYTSRESRRFYDELTPIPTLPVSMRIVVSYAGFEGEGDIMEQLVKRGMLGVRVFPDLPVWRNGGLFLYYDTGEEARRMPWQQGPRGARYYADQRNSLTPNQYLRLHENRFTSREDRFITEPQYDANVDKTHHMLPPNKLVPVTVGVDIGPKHDTSGVVGTYRDVRGRVALAFARKWEPQPDENFIDEVEAFLLELHGKYKLRRVFYDEYQFMAQGQRLKKKHHLPMESWIQNPENLTTMSSNLLDLLKSHRLRLYPDRDLRDHVVGAVAIESPRGMRIAKEKASKKIDLCVALAMASLDTVTAPGGTNLNALQTVSAAYRTKTW